MTLPYKPEIALLEFNSEKQKYMFTQNLYKCSHRVVQKSPKLFFPDALYQING